MALDRPAAWPSLDTMIITSIHGILAALPMLKHQTRHVDKVWMSGHINQGNGLNPPHTLSSCCCTKRLLSGLIL
jgi:hypothetical protein